jgi:CRP-like cAMP-binding protein/signal transduction histidine kinase
MPPVQPQIFEKRRSFKAAPSPAELAVLFSQVPLFKDLTPEQLSLISQHMNFCTKKAGENLMVQGQPVPAVYIIHKSTVDVLVNDDRVAQRGALDSLGEMSCLAGEDIASATVRAITPCQVWQIERDIFLKVIDAIPPLRAKLHSTISNRLQALSHRFSEILKHIPHGIVKIDLNGVITDEFSSRCTDYLGISQLTGKMLGGLLFSENRALEAKWDQVIHSFSAEAGSGLLQKLDQLPEEVVYRHPDGGERIFRLIYHVTTDKHDQVTGLDIGLDDVSQKRQYQDDLSSFQDLMTNMEQLLIMFESDTGLIVQETITHSHLGQVHFPIWKNLKGRNIFDTLLVRQDPEQHDHFQRWLKMLGESFILETMSREELIDLAPRFTYETVLGDVVELSFNLNPGQSSSYSEVLGKLDFVANDSEEAGNQISTMELMEEIVAAEEEHQSALPEALNEMQISLEYAQSQMVTPNALAANYRQVAGLIHSVKGLGQAFGIQTISTAAHELEDALEKTIKGGQSPTLSSELLISFKLLLSLIVVSKSLSSADHVKDLGHCRSRRPEICLSLEQFQQVKQDLSLLQDRYPDPETAAIVKRLNDMFSSIDMMGLETIFPRLERVITDTAGLLHKQVTFRTEEKKPVFLDRLMGHTVGTCLIQMIKNAVFHGIEASADRRFLGKPETALVELIAARDKETVHICVRDDGKGINTDMVLERAIQLKLLEPETAEQLRSENRREEIFSLLFEPGFSTAGSVSLISGMGVGMSLIRSEIEGLGGTVTVRSKENQGTEIILTIPITPVRKASNVNQAEF